MGVIAADLLVTLGVLILTYHCSRKWGPCFGGSPAAGGPRARPRGKCLPLLGRVARDAAEGRGWEGSPGGLAGAHTAGQLTATILGCSLLKRPPPSSCVAGQREDRPPPVPNPDYEVRTGLPFSGWEEPEWVQSPSPKERDGVMPALCLCSLSGGASGRCMLDWSPGPSESGACWRTRNKRPASQSRGTCNMICVDWQLLLQRLCLTKCASCTRELMPGIKL